MPALSQKRILLGVSGGIAAYKSADLLRRLQDQGADVRVMMTDEAQAFITPLTFESLSGHTVLTNADRHDGMLHIDLARWADLIIVAPATANTLARLATGQADELLTTTCLASNAIMTVAPAMNQQMWSNPATQNNISRLAESGVHILGPGEGYQACGETGAGRMLEPAELVNRILQLLEGNRLSGRHVLITAGPTIEPIDPARFISNRSSGKMGYALAQAALELGARVTLVSGPCHIEAPERAELISVQTAAQMLDAVMSRIAQADIFIAAAAVADYRVATPANRKIKKKADTLSLELVRNPDILATVGEQAGTLFKVGFAAETDDLEAHARLKLQQKNLNMIAANLIGAAAAEQQTGFESDYNALTVITPSTTHTLEKAGKYTIARQLMELIVNDYEKNTA